MKRVKVIIGHLLRMFFEFKTGRMLKFILKLESFRFCFGLKFLALTKFFSINFGQHPNYRKKINEPVNQVRSINFICKNWIQNLHFEYPLALILEFKALTNLALCQSTYFSYGMWFHLFSFFWFSNYKINVSCI